MKNVFKIKDSDNYVRFGKRIIEGWFNDIYDCEIINKEDKVILPNLVAKKLRDGLNPLITWRSDREMRYLERLDDEKILKPIYCDYDEYFIVMEKFPLTLETYINSPNFNKQDGYKVFADILEGVKYYLDQGILHRDLKPQNILMKLDNSIIITDFGAAGRLQTENGEDTKNLTKAGEVIYTEFFCSPEQRNNLLEADEKSDIYSLGKVLYCIETVECKHNFLDKSKITPIKMKHIIGKASNENPINRYQSIRDFISEFNTILTTKEDLHLSSIYTMSGKQIAKEINGKIDVFSQGEIFIIETIESLITKRSEIIIDVLVYLDIESHEFLVEKSNENYEQLIRISCESMDTQSFPFDYIDTIAIAFTFLLSKLKNVIDIELQAFLIDSLVSLAKSHNRYYAMEIVGKCISEIEEPIILEYIIKRAFLNDYNGIQAYKDSNNIKYIISELAKKE